MNKFVIINFLILCLLSFNMFVDCDINPMLEAAKEAVKFNEKYGTVTCIIIPRLES